MATGFRHGLVDENVPEHRDASSSSYELLVEPRAKVVASKHNIYILCPKDPNCDVCLRTKITRAYCRRRTGTVVPRAEIFGDLITADHKVLGDDIIIDTLWRYKTWLLSGYNLTHVKRKLLRKPREACKGSWSRPGNPKSFTLTIPWNLANLVKNFLGIIVREHRTNQRRMGLLREQCAESRKRHVPYCCNQV